jgi:hypothetical protein
VAEAFVNQTRDFTATQKASPLAIQDSFEVTSFGRLTDLGSVSSFVRVPQRSSANGRRLCSFPRLPNACSCGVRAEARTARERAECRSPPRKELRNQQFGRASLGNTMPPLPSFASRETHTHPKRKIATPLRSHDTLSPRQHLWVNFADRCIHKKSPEEHLSMQEPQKVQS